MPQCYAKKNPQKPAGFFFALARGIRNPMLDAIAPNGEQSLFRRSAPYESPARCGNVSNAAMLRQEKPAETCGFFCCFEKIKRKRDKPQSRRDLPRERRRCAAGSRVSLRRKCVRGCSRCPIFRRCRQRRLSCGSPCRDIRRRHPWSFRPWCKRFCTPRLCCPSPP